MSIIFLASLLGLGAAPARAENPFDAEVKARRAQAMASAGKAEAIVPLLGVLDLWELADDRVAVGAMLDEVAASPAQRADVRGRATFLRSILDDRVGAREAGERRRAALGLLTQWQLLGPFDDEGKANDRVELAPEKDLAAGLPVDAKKTYPGKERAVSWRPMAERGTVEGQVPLDAALRPDAHVLGYATTFIKVDKAQWAAVRTGSTGAIKVWVNRTEALSRDAYRPLRLDQDAGLAWLSRGWNRITIKVGAQEGGWSFFLRLTQPDGSPLPFTASTSLLHGAEVVESPSKQKAPPLADLGADLKARAESGSAEASRALGLYLHYISPLDVGPGETEAEKMLRFAAEAKPSTEGYREVAMAAHDLDSSRKWLEQALSPAVAGKASPFDRARALTELGELYSRMHRDRRAEELWREAEKVDPAFFPAALLLADQIADRGLPAQAEAMIDKLAAHHPALKIGKAAAQLADRRGHRAVAEKRYKALAEAAHDDLVALRGLFSYAKSRGDVAGALAFLDRMAEARPDLPTITVDRAEFLDGIGRSAEAHTTLARALSDCPDDPKLLERDGRVLHRLGRDAEAMVCFRRALELRPQNPDLRAYLGDLESRDQKKKSGGSADDLARGYTRPVEELIASARKDPKPIGPARVLLDLTATRVHQNGLSETFSERVVEVLDERGAREQGQTSIRYTPDTQSVQIKAARVYKKNGDVIEAPSETDHDTSEPWYGLYYDTRAQTVEFPRLEPGDVVDLEYVISDVANRNMFADYFGDVHALQEDLPRRATEYVLITPKTRAFYFNKPRLASLTVEDKVVGDERVYRYRAEGVPKVEAEPGMPGFTSVAAYIHVSTYKSWEDVATWYQGLVRGQLDVDDAIRDAVKKAVAGKTDEREKIRAIYDTVVKQTRYVGLEFGIHGYKPYAVTQVFHRKFGDCKDKASLLVAMLRQIGVEATLTLARTRRGGDLDAYPASLAPFDHAIAYVPKYNLFLDGTAEFSGSDELPAQDQDIPVLLVSDPAHGGRGHLARTPVLAEEKNRVMRDLEVRLDKDGAAKVDLRMRVSGEAAHEWRNHYQTEGERRERFEKSENASHPGARVTKVDFPSLADLEHGVEAHAQMEVPSWAHAAGAGADSQLAMPALGRDGELLRSYARLSSRKQDLVLGYPWTQEEHVKMVLPEHFTAKRLPEQRSIQSPFGSFTLKVESKGGEVLLETSLRVNRHKIAAADYPAFRRFCLDVDAAVGQELVIAHD